MSPASEGLAGIDHPREARHYVDLGEQVDEEPLPPAEAWEHFNTVTWCYALEFIRQEADEAIGTLADAVRDGRRPTAEQVRAAREALDRAQALVEDHYAPITAKRRSTERAIYSSVSSSGRAVAPSLNRSRASSRASMSP